MEYEEALYYMYLGTKIAHISWDPRGYIYFDPRRKVIVDPENFCINAGTYSDIYPNDGWRIFEDPTNEFDRVWKTLNNNIEQLKLELRPILEVLTLRKLVDDLNKDRPENPIQFICVGDDLE